jgi:hypothetical protein
MTKNPLEIVRCRRFIEDGQERGGDATCCGPYNYQGDYHGVRVTRLTIFLTIAAEKH